MKEREEEKRKDRRRKDRIDIKKKERKKGSDNRLERKDKGFK